MSSSKTEAGTAVVLENGKYVWRHENGCHLRCDRHGEAWADEITPSKAVLALVQEVESLREKLAEVHSWIVCACIATPEDMMQSAARIEEITRP